jgi:hypothetical protein
MSYLAAQALAGAVDGEVGAGDFGSCGQVPELGGIEVGIGVRIDDLAAGLAVEMHVLVEVCAVAGLAALEVNKFDKPVRR